MPNIPHVVQFWESKSEESDRSLVIIGAALIDEEIEELLGSFFIEDRETSEALLSPTGPLGAFGVRNKLAYALGLIDTPTYKDIKLIQKIRNQFAHISADIDFSDSKIQGMTASLVIPQWVGEPEDEDPDSPRGKFYSGVRGILWHLATESLRLKREGRRQKPEPIYPLGDRDGIEFESD
jgi:hypothetical protein